MNFNTNNNTFRQLMGNGLSYRVPLFQRDYSWGPDEWDDLWQDIVALFDDDPEPAHYMGYLVLQSADNRAFDIIDGQQRMTTLSLLMLAAVSHLSDLAAPDDPGDPETRRAEQCAIRTTARGAPRNAPACPSCRCSTYASLSRCCWQRSIGSRNRTGPGLRDCYGQ